MAYGDGKEVAGALGEYSVNPNNRLITEKFIYVLEGLKWIMM